MRRGKDTPVACGEDTESQNFDGHARLKHGLLDCSVARIGEEPHVVERHQHEENRGARAAKPVKGAAPEGVAQGANHRRDERVARVVDAHRAAVVQSEPCDIAVDLLEIALVVRGRRDDVHEGVETLDRALLQHEAPLMRCQRAEQTRTQLPLLRT